jgi:hypothetical protein
VALSTHGHLVPKLRMRGTITSTTPFFFMAWCLIKHKTTARFYRDQFDISLLCYMTTGELSVLTFLRRSVPVQTLKLKLWCIQSGVLIIPGYVLLYFSVLNSPLPFCDVAYYSYAHLQKDKCSPYIKINISEFTGSPNFVV